MIVITKLGKAKETSTVIGTSARVERLQHDLKETKYRRARVTILERSEVIDTMWRGPTDETITGNDMRTKGGRVDDGIGVWAMRWFDERRMNGRSNASPGEGVEARMEGGCSCAHIDALQKIVND